MIQKGFNQAVKEMEADDYDRTIEDYLTETFKELNLDVVIQTDFEIHEVDNMEMQLKTPESDSTESPETEPNKYAFIFEYENSWMVIAFENNTNKYFNSCEDNWDNILSYLELFLKNGGDLYQYTFSSYDMIANTDIFNLKNEPIPKLASYLKMPNFLDLTDDYPEHE